MALLIYSIKQFQLAAMYLPILFPLLSNIFFDHFLISILSNCIHIISARPKLSSPQLPLHFRLPLKYLSCRYAFRYLYYSLWQHHWHTLHQKMHMIFITPNLNISYFKSSTYFHTYLFKSLFHCLREYVSSVFRRTNYVIQQYRLVMSLDYMLAHRAYSNTHPVASYEEFFRLKSRPTVF